VCSSATAICARHCGSEKQSEVIAQEIGKAGKEAGDSNLEAMNLKKFLIFSCLPDSNL
jgi:hypothetical protein